MKCSKFILAILLIIAAIASVDSRRKARKSRAVPVNTSLTANKTNCSNSTNATLCPKPRVILILNPTKLAIQMQANLIEILTRCADSKPIVDELNKLALDYKGMRESYIVIDKTNQGIVKKNVTRNVTNGTGPAAVKAARRRRLFLENEEANSVDRRRVRRRAVNGTASNVTGPICDYTLSPEFAKKIQETAKMYYDQIPAIYNKTFTLNCPALLNVRGASIEMYTGDVINQTIALKEQFMNTYGYNVDIDGPIKSAEDSLKPEL